MGILRYALIILLIENTVDLACANKVTRAFKQYEVVPDYVSEAPRCLIEVEFPSDVEANLGNILTTKDTKYRPSIAYEADETKFYTLCLSDHDVPSKENSTMGEFLHWLVVNIPEDEVKKGQVLAAYIGPEPPKGTSYHRYVFLAYEQPEKLTFNETKLSAGSSDGRYKFSISDFAKKYNLGEPIAGNFFRAQYGG